MYTEIGPDCPVKTLQGIIRGKIDAVTTANTDGWRGYDGLVDVGFDRHFRVCHGRDDFVLGASRINGIESFWSFAKARLQPFKGVPKHTFALHLKEPEFRSNHRHADRCQLLLKNASSTTPLTKFASQAPCLTTPTSRRWGPEA